MSTDEQASSGAGLDAQRAAIAAEAERRAWNVVAWPADEGISGGKGVEYRPGLAAAIDAVEAGQAAALLAAKLDRIRGRTRHCLSYGTGAAWRLGAGDV